MHQQDGSIHEREPVSKIAGAISIALNAKEGEVISPQYDKNAPPPFCTERDFTEMAKVIREFANEEDGISQIHLGSWTSETAIDLGDSNPQWRDTSSIINFRLLCNTFLSQEFKRFPSSAPLLAFNVKEGHPLPPKPETGWITPLSVGEKYFGIAQHTLPQFSREQLDNKPQFGLIFSVICDQKMKDPGQVFYQLLKLNNKVETQDPM